MKTAQKKTLKILWLMLAVFFLWLAYQIPYTHDDWDWGNPVGITQLVMATVNSRYAGNLLVVILTRSEFIKTLVVGLFFFLLPPYMLYVMTGRRPELTTESITLLLISYALMVGFPVGIWQQTNGWVSGFANYSFSTVLLAVFTKQCVDLFSEETERCPKAVTFALNFFVSFTVQMFLENITVYIAAVAICVFTACWIYDRKLSSRALALLLGAVLGAVLMFSSNIYGELLSSGQAVGDYRKLTVDISGGLFTIMYQAIYNYIAVILTYLYKVPWQYSLLLIIIMFLLGFSDKANVQKTMFLPVQVINALFMVYFAAQPVGIDYWLCQGNTHYMAILRLLSSVGFFAIVALQIFMYEKDLKKALLAMSVWFSVPAVMLPLAVVNMIDHRSFFTPLFFMAMLIIFVADKLLQQIKGKWLKAVCAISAAALFVICLRLGCVYHEIGLVKHQRDMLIEQAKAESLEEIVFPPYKNKSYLWLPDPSGYISAFREFYDLDDSVSITIEGTQSK